MTTVQLRSWQQLKREMKQEHPDFTNQQVSIEVDKIWRDADKKQMWIDHYISTYEPNESPSKEKSPEESSKASKSKNIKPVSPDYKNSKLKELNTKKKIESYESCSESSDDELPKKHQKKKCSSKKADLKDKDKDWKKKYYKLKYT